MHSFDGLPAQYIVLLAKFTHRGPQCQRSRSRGLASSVLDLSCEEPDRSTTAYIRHEPVNPHQHHTHTEVNRVTPIRSKNNTDNAFFLLDAGFNIGEINYPLDEECGIGSRNPQHSHAIPDRGYSEPCTFHKCTSMRRLIGGPLQIVFRTLCRHHHHGPRHIAILGH